MERAELRAELHKSLEAREKAEAAEGASKDPELDESRLETEELNALLEARESWRLEQRARALRRSVSVNIRATNLLKDAIRHLEGLDRARNDVQSLRDWVEIPGGLLLRPGSAAWVDFQEKCARGFEQYFMEGRAPSAGLRGVFTRFRNWLSRIYQRANRRLAGKSVRRWQRSLSTCWPQTANSARSMAWPESWKASWISSGAWPPA